MTPRWQPQPDGPGEYWFYGWSCPAHRERRPTEPLLILATVFDDEIVLCDDGYAYSGAQAVGHWLRIVRPEPPAREKSE